jgi:hypothetical protein
MSSAIERALRDVSARRLRTHKLAKTELLHLADQRASLFVFLPGRSGLFLGNASIRLSFDRHTGKNKTFFSLSHFFFPLYTSLTYILLSLSLNTLNLPS